MNIGIVGCGGISRLHIEAYLKQNARVTAVTDAVPEAAQAAAEAAGGAEVYADYGDLVDRAHADGISICTPPAFHADAAIYALEHGVSVLCEKPMAHNTESARCMAESAGQSKALLMPAFRHRFIPANIALRELVHSGAIGEVVFFNNIFCGPAFGMEGRWFTKKQIAGGGCILDTSSHSVDLFRFIVGEIAEQSAAVSRRFRTTDVEDTGVLVAKTSDGVIGIMQSSFVAGDGLAFIDILGTKGRARFDYFEPEKVLVRKTEDTDWTVQAVQSSEGFDEEIAHFLGAVRGEHPLSCNVEDGLRAVEIVMSAYETAGPV